MWQKLRNRRCFIAHVVFSVGAESVGLILILWLYKIKYFLLIYRAYVIRLLLFQRLDEFQYLSK